MPLSEQDVQQLLLREKHGLLRRQARLEAIEAELTGRYADLLERLHGQDRDLSDRIAGIDRHLLLLDGRIRELERITGAFCDLVLAVTTELIEVDGVAVDGVAVDGAEAAT